MENDYNRNQDCIPEETCEQETTQNADTIVHTTDSSRAVENEISWADTLKYYSKSQQEICSPLEVYYFADSIIHILKTSARYDLSYTILTLAYVIEKTHKCHVSNFAIHE